MSNPIDLKGWMKRKGRMEFGNYVQMSRFFDDSDAKLDLIRSSVETMARGFAEAAWRWGAAIELKGKFGPKFIYSDPAEHIEAPLRSYATFGAKCYATIKKLPPERFAPYAEMVLHEKNREIAWLKQKNAALEKQAAEAGLKDLDAEDYV